MPDINKCKQILQALKVERASVENLIEDVQGLVLPFRGDINEEWAPDYERIPPTFDPTAIIALHNLASFLSGSIFNPSEMWLRLRAALPEENKDPKIRAALDEASAELMTYLDDSNFYCAMATWLKDLAGIGNATLLIEERPQRFRDNGNIFGGFQFEAVPWGQIFWRLDRFGRVVELARELKLWPVRAEEFFGRPFEGEEEICFYNVVVKEGGTWYSCWWEEGAESIIRTDEWEVMPYVCGVWDRTDNHSYGYGPGHQVRPAIAGLNEMTRQIIQAVGRDLNPLLLVEHGSHLSLDVGNNGVVTMKRTVTQPPSFLNSNSNFAAAAELRAIDQQQIRQAFFADVLSEPETQTRSAEAERAKASRLAMRMSGPAQNVSLYLSEIVGACMMLARRSGALQSLDGISGVRPVFVSPFFTNAKATMLDRILGTTAEVAQLASLLQDPSWLAVINKEGIQRLIAELSDMPESALNSPEQVAAQLARDAEAAADQRLNEAVRSGAVPGLETQLELGRGNLPSIGGE